MLFHSGALQNTGDDHVQQFRIHLAAQAGNHGIVNALVEFNPTRLRGESAGNGGRSGKRCRGMVS
jgi:hypothetical protein